MPEKTFLEQISEILIPKLKIFKTWSPKQQRKYLGWLDKLIAEEKREFEKDIAVRVRKLFAQYASPEVQDAGN